MLPTSGTATTPTTTLTDTAIIGRLVSTKGMDTRISKSCHGVVDVETRPPPKSRLALYLQKGQATAESCSMPPAISIVDAVSIPVPVPASPPTTIIGSGRVSCGETTHNIDHSQHHPPIMISEDDEALPGGPYHHLSQGQFRVQPQQQQQVEQHPQLQLHPELLEPQHQQQQLLQQPAEVQKPTLSSSPKVQFSCPKQVRFSYVTIRNYDITMSDNPAVSAGPPIQLDWKYEQLPIIPIREFEAYRSPRRAKQMSHMFISPDFRRGILTRAGFTERQIDANDRLVAKIQKNRTMTCLSFPFYRVEYAVRSAGRKIQRTGMSLGGKKNNKGSGTSKNAKRGNNNNDDEATVRSLIDDMTLSSEALIEEDISSSDDDSDKQHVSVTRPSSSPPPAVVLRSR
jgi:hypothetical protein